MRTTQCLALLCVAAFGVSTIYIVVPLVAAYVVFLRRDVAGD
jgi:ABC-type transport system involved in multi-copper enzyme maturation permease subunit